MMKQFTPDQPLWVVGCGNMGGALLDGWLRAGLDAAAVVAVARRFDERAPQPDGVTRVGSVAAIKGPAPKAVVLGVKPYQLEDIAAQLLGTLPDDCLIYSVLGGPTILRYQAAFGAASQVVRAMPNTPVAVGEGVTGLVASDALSEDNRSLAHSLAEAVGTAVWLQDEEMMDALSAVAGSGPAFLFHFVEALSAAAQHAGFNEADATRLARSTVVGAASLLKAQPERSAADLRQAVTSPGGSTAAGLQAQCVDEPADSQSLQSLMIRTISASIARSREMASE